MPAHRIVPFVPASARSRFGLFRDGIFVGEDAWYCCLNHPSPALRAQLELSNPLERGLKPKMEDVDQLVDHAYGLLQQDPSTAKTLLTYKPTATVEEVSEMASILFDLHEVSPTLAARHYRVFRWRA